MNCLRILSEKNVNSTDFSVIKWLNALPYPSTIYLFFLKKYKVFCFLEVIFVHCWGVGGGGWGASNEHPSFRKTILDSPMHFECILSPIDIVCLNHLKFIYLWFFFQENYCTKHGFFIKLTLKSHLRSVKLKFLYSNFTFVSLPEILRYN